MEKGTRKGGIGMNVPTAIDLIQLNNPLEVPEIRVWCHPRYIGRDGADYYYVFGSFEDALDFIAEHPESEKAPLIAFRGYEFNLFGVETCTNNLLHLRDSARCSCEEGNLK
jgi:hypothetical protein